MEDLSSIFARLGGDPITALAPTSQAAGNMQSSPRLAMTARGSEPVDPLPDRDHQGDPTVGAQSYDTPVLRGPDGASRRPDNADRSNPFSEPDGGGWQRGSDHTNPVSRQGSRMMIRRGEWNDI